MSTKIPTSSSYISVVGVGKYRSIALDIVQNFNGTPFTFAAMLDTNDSAKLYTFTPDRLRIVLRALHPAPQCLIAGGAIEEQVNEAAVEVWREFVTETFGEDEQQTLLINVSHDEAIK